MPHCGILWVCHVGLCTYYFLCVYVKCSMCACLQYMFLFLNYTKHRCLICDNFQMYTEVTGMKRAKRYRGLIPVLQNNFNNLLTEPILGTIFPNCKVCSGVFELITAVKRDRGITFHQWQYSLGYKLEICMALPMTVLVGFILHTVVKCQGSSQGTSTVGM